MIILNFLTKKIQSHLKFITLSIIHWPYQNFGPLINASTLASERTLRTQVRTVEGYRNWLNLSLSILLNQQYLFISQINKLLNFGNLFRLIMEDEKYNKELACKLNQDQQSSRFLVKIFYKKYNCPTKLIEPVKERKVEENKSFKQKLKENVI